MGKNDSNTGHTLSRGNGRFGNSRCDDSTGQVIAMYAHISLLRAVDNLILSDVSLPWPQHPGCNLASASSIIFVAYLLLMLCETGTLSLHVPPKPLLIVTVYSGSGVDTDQSMASMYVTQFCLRTYLTHHIAQSADIAPQSSRSSIATVGPVSADIRVG